MKDPEKREGIADDARKFIVTDIDPQLLEGENVAVFQLTVDWLQTGEDDEEKVVLKEFPDGRVQRFLVAKVTKDGKRTTVKEEITEEEYNRRLAEASSVSVRVSKKRYEFVMRQGEIDFEIKYDEYDGSNNLRILEVDASSRRKEERDLFDPAIIIGAAFTEVVEDRGYEGYRVADKA